MPRQTGKGSRRRQAAFERGRTQHHQFIGDAEPEREEAASRKREHLEAEGSEQAVPEIPFRIPRSIEEGKRLIREAPDALREKARERLEKLPEGAQKAIGLAQEVAGLCFAPVRIGLRLTREVLRVPLEMIRVLRHKEA